MKGGTFGRRVAALEQRHKREKTCPACGRGPGRFTGTVKVRWSDEPSDTPTHCPACGRLQVLAITFDQEG